MRDQSDLSHGTAEIIVILDRSGSMLEVASDAIGGFNAFVAARRAAEPDARLTLVLFDNRYEVPFNAVPLSEVPLLTDKLYVPRGSTALHDAIGRTIVERSAAIEAVPPTLRPSRVVIAILTDGYENSSRRFTGPQIQELIGRKRAQGWEFLFLAADQDAIAGARNLNIPDADAIPFSKEDHGTRATFYHLNEKVSEKLHRPRARPRLPQRRSDSPSDSPGQPRQSLK